MTTIGYFGAGTWGVCLASLLASKGHRVNVWTRDHAFAELLQTTRVHPKLPGCVLPETVTFTNRLTQALDEAEVVVESITSAGVRPLFQELAAVRVPIIVTSKGIEQGSGLLLPEVVKQIVGHNLVGCLSGPSHAEEVIHGLPTAVVCSGYDDEVIRVILELFTTPSFRVYPNGDLAGVAFGGAMKNVIAIACGISDGLGCGDNAKAVLMTRGLHEMRKLARVKGCKAETLNGLSGLGDLCVTCLSTHSRNTRFGRLLAEGASPEMAHKQIGMAVEGAYACLSVYELAQQHNLPVPITEAVYGILYGGLSPKEAVQRLMQRTVKEEHL